MGSLADSTQVYLGNQDVDKLYSGNNLLWAKAYLIPTVGTVTTPDPGPLPNECTFVFKVQGPIGQTGTFVSKWSNTTEWIVNRFFPSGSLALTFHTGTAVDGRVVADGGITETDQFLAFAIHQNNGTQSVSRAWSSQDGVSWTPFAPLLASPIVIRASTDTVRIGAYGGSGDIELWPGRIYSVELKTGLEPSGPIYSYLEPTIGTVTTPDPGPLPNECTFVFHTQAGGTGTLASHMDQPTATQWAWAMDRYANGNMDLVTSADGSTRVDNAVPGPALSVERFAFTFTVNSGAMRVWQSDGQTWTQVGTATSVPRTIFDTSGQVKVGAYAVATQPWDRRIYSVELRTGLDPNGGNIIWKFDANDYPGSGTSYVDPRGRTWTLTNSNAIKKSGVTLWKFDANDYPGTGTVYTDPRGRTWTLTNAAAIVS